MADGFEVNAERIIHETLDGEVVAIDLSSGTYYSMRGTAQAVWDGITTGATVDGIVSRVAAAFDAGGIDVRASILGFIQVLEAKCLILPSGAAEESAGDEISAGGSPLPRYEDPVLATFTDLQDLILLDPVHDVDPGKGWPNPIDETRAAE